MPQSKRVEPTLKVGKIMRKSLVESAASQIEEGLCRNRFQAGDKLPTEKELTEKFGVNRSTVGEALSLMQSRGIIERIQGSGTFVKNMGLESVSQTIRRFVLFGNTTPIHLIQFRELLEPEIVAFVAEHAENKDIELVEKAYAKLSEVYMLPNHPELASVDTNFHYSIAMAARNHFVSLIFDGIRDPLVRLMNAQRSLWNEEGISSPRFEQMLEIHHLIFKAIRDRKPEEARNLMREHMAVSKATYNHELYSIDWKALHSEKKFGLADLVSLNSGSSAA